MSPPRAETLCHRLHVSFTKHHVLCAAIRLKRDPVTEPPGGRAAATRETAPSWRLASSVNDRRDCPQRSLQVPRSLCRCSESQRVPARTSHQEVGGQLARHRTNAPRAPWRWVKPSPPLPPPGQVRGQPAPPTRHRGLLHGPGGGRPQAVRAPGDGAARVCPSLCREEGTAQTTRWSAGNADGGRGLAPAQAQHARPLLSLSPPRCSGHMPWAWACRCCACR